MCKDSICKKLFYPIFNFAAHSILPSSLQEARTFYIQCFQRGEVLLQHLPITSFVKYLPNLVFVTILGKTISLGREQFFPS